MDRPKGRGFVLCARRCLKGSRLRGRRTRFLLWKNPSAHKGKAGSVELEDQPEVGEGRPDTGVAWARLGKGVQRSQFETYFRGPAARPC